MSGKNKQKLVLYSACEPSLKGGEYLVEVTRQVSHTDKVLPAKPEDSLAFSDNLTRKLKFRVATPRYALPPTDIFECYPPDGAKGVFSDTLPHIVLSRRTLPWERTPGTGQQSGRPWLALLLLAEDEMGTKTAQDTYLPLYKVETLPVKQLSEGQFSPGDEDNCLVLKLPFTKFQEIAPTWDDLPYTAHVREVGNTANMDSTGIEDKGWFSVVVCNRLPKAGMENHVFLVSLEGLRGCSPAGYTPAKDEKVSLVVLASWRFMAVPKGSTDGKTFSELLKELNCAPLRCTDTDPDINSVLQFGYVPLVHHTAEGHRTVSWYRGPLTPHFIPTAPTNISYPSADAALRYDTQEGLLDVSYAAAWQLGRLLGLQDQPFARALNRLKAAVARRAAEALVAQTLKDCFGKSAEELKELVGNIFREKDKSAKPPSGAERPKEPPAYYEDLYSKINQGFEIPNEIRQWLGHLFLLHGVPFHYLVSDPDLLPAESLRFFYLDSGWIAALMDGALSVGRSTQSQLYLDKAMAGNFLADIASTQIECSMKSTKDEDIKDIDVPDAKGANILGHITGFLLRSRLVEAWRGIEITGMRLDAKGSEEPAPILRLQRITRDTLLAIYNGHIRAVRIIQPPQALHFGVENASGVLKFHDKAGELKFQDVPARDNPAVFAGALLKKRVQRTIRLDVKAGKPPKD